MVKQPKERDTIQEAVVLERQYGRYNVKVCFASQGQSGAVQKVLNAVMQAFRSRMESKCD